jgi:very-short-patch-repair endonuclease
LPAHCAGSRFEQLLWSRLRKRQQEGCTFCRQQVTEPYIVDFLSVQPKLVIEMDGGQHEETALQDAQRTGYLRQLGYQVVRYWNDQVLGDVEAVMESIRAVLI